MSESIIFFDGVCNLCNGFVQYIIKHDQKNHFKFSSLQSKYAQNLIDKKNPELKKIDSVIVYTDQKFITKSSAVFKIIKELGFPINLLLILSFLPVKFRDLIYDFIAKKRYNWFGKKEKCIIPSLSLMEKFIE